MSEMEMSKEFFCGHKFLKIVPTEGEQTGYFGVSEAKDWRAFLTSRIALENLPEEGWKKTIGNISHRLCGQEVKLALLRSNVEFGKSLRPAIEHSLIHDFFFNTHSIYEGVFTMIAHLGEQKKLQDFAWKKPASDLIFKEDWVKSENGTYGEGTFLYEDVILLRDRIHQDSSNSKELEFSPNSYATHFQRNLLALGKLIKHLESTPQVLPPPAEEIHYPSTTNLLDDFSLGKRANYKSTKRSNPGT